MSANSRALAPPRRPPHAPQSCADSCGLFRLVEPWPRKTTTGAKSRTRPMFLSMPATRSAVSSSENPTGLPPSRRASPRPAQRRQAGRRTRRHGAPSCARPSALNARGASTCAMVWAAASGPSSEREAGAATERARRRGPRGAPSRASDRAGADAACASPVGVDRLLVNLVGRRHHHGAVRRRARRRGPGSRWRRRRTRQRRR